MSFLCCLTGNQHSETGKFWHWPVFYIFILNRNLCWCNFIAKFLSAWCIMSLPLSPLYCFCTILYIVQYCTICSKNYPKPNMLFKFYHYATFFFHRFFFVFYVKCVHSIFCQMQFLKCFVRMWIGKLKSNNPALKPLP